MFFVDVDIMTTDQLKEVLGNYKWTLLVALIMFAMVGFGYKLARIIDEGDSKKVQAQKETIAILSEENHALTIKVNQLEVAMELATLETESITNTLGEQKKELDEYSEGVNKRIAKLTRRMREAERQKEEAIEYAKNQKTFAERYKKRYEALDGDYTKEFEKRVTSGTESIKTKLAAAIASGDVNAQVEAQSELAQLSMDASRLARLKQVDEIH